MCALAAAAVAVKRKAERKKNIIKGGQKFTICECIDNDNANIITFEIFT